VRGLFVRASLFAALATVLLGLGRFPVARATTPVQTISASVGANPVSQPMPKGFVGLSVEYPAVRAYTGGNEKKVNPVLVQLIRNLAPGGQSPVVRIGGDSTDSTWWPIRGVKRPLGISYTLTSDWLRTTVAFARDARAQLIMGVNLAAGRPAFAAAEARAMLQGIGRRHIDAFEIGNEPDVYGMFPWYQTRSGHDVYSRASSYDLGRYVLQFSAWRRAMPRAPIAGPAFAELTWLDGLPQFIAAEPGLKLVTLHRYPLRACIDDPTSPIFPSIANLLGDQASSGLAQQVAPYVSEVHARHLAFRLDELNSASCSGEPGVSDTFASALWVLDTLFNLASVDVDGVNIHSLPGAAYAPFSFKHQKSRWEAFVHPEYYGMLLFAQAFPPGAQLLPVTASPSGPLKVWATGGPGFRTRVIVINKDPGNGYDVQLQVPSFGDRAATVERLQAPSLSATSDVSLGGLTFGSVTRTGVLPGRLQTESAAPNGDMYTITMPPASAAVLIGPA
jgi:hypothetical protein